MNNEYRVNRVSFERLDITNYDGSKTVNLKNLVQEFNLHEDFMQMTMYGNMVLFDSIDFMQEFPVVGEEEISITFSFQSSVEDIQNTKIKKTFKTYKISDISRGKNDKAQAYSIHFVSPEQYKNLAETVPDAFTDKKISTMAKSIYNNYIKLDNKKVFDVEETKTEQSLIIPYIYPFQAMSMLTKRAWSRNNKSSNYVFYEDRDGFHFRTVESFLNNEPVQTYYYRQSLGQYPNKKIENKEQIEPFIIRNLVIQQYRDNIKHLIDQMYNSQIDTLDIISKKYQKRNYDYDDEFDRIKHLEKYPLKTNQTHFFNNDNMYYPSNKNASNLSYVKDNGGIKPKFWEDMLPERKSAFAQLDTIVLEVTIPGDHNRKPGDIINFDLPSATDLEDLQGKHKYLSGKYLVTRVRHKINNESYSTVMQIVKESSPKKIKPLEA